MEELQVGNFPWTPGGIKLLNTINDFIEANGGCEALAEEIEMNLFNQDKRRLENIFKKTIKYKIPYTEAADLVNMSYNDFAKMILIYKKGLSTPDVEIFSRAPD